MKEIVKYSGYNHRFLARFVIEAATPLAVGSGEKDILTDALVATDVNGLPYIPGTAIAGVVRHMIANVKPQGFDENQIFGFQKEQDGRGSEIIFTEAKIINSNGKVVDGISLNADNKNSFLQCYKELPIRQHVRINERGVTDKAGKFDEQVCFAGTRFCFELEMVAKEKTIVNFDKILEQVQSQTFRIGGGTRSGFGKIKVVDLQTRMLDLKKGDELQLYLKKSSNLAETWDGWEQKSVDTKPSSGWTEYELKLQPEDFFHFGSGFGDDEVDMTPVKEKKVVWKDGVGEMTEDLVLIPAASVKGALAHRVAYHYNRLTGVFAEKLTTDDERKKVVGKNNEAVKELFGSEGERGENSNEMKDQKRGNLLFSDVIMDKKMNDKILNHVAIDRFTGGAIDGALFSEKTTYGKGQEFTMTILADNSALKGKVKEALEESLKDICKGLLPLGGGVNRGNGVFTGSLKQQDTILYQEKEA